VAGSRRWRGSRRAAARRGRLAAALRDLDAKPLHNYDGVTHRGLFCLPKVVREAMAKETRVMTKDNPVFLT
jgi:hypothetical protein